MPSAWLPSISSDRPVPHRARLRLPFLDGIRGLAAAYVLLFHIYDGQEVHFGMRLPLPARLLLGWMSYGYLAVSVFIVLSGYSLMLPLVRSGGRMQDGVAQYFARRARRILPPYYAALVLSILLIVAYLVKHHGVTDPDSVSSGGRGALDAGPVVSHLLLMHNLYAPWALRINGPMWSVATEWQIYVLLPTVLLPLWRRAGNIPLVACALALGILPVALLPADSKLSWAHPWFIGLFAMGMAAAVIAPSQGDVGRVGRRPWFLLAAMLLGLTVAARQLASSASWSGGYLVEEVVAGASTTCLIAGCANQAAAAISGSARGWLLGALESRMALWLGKFSYSLYLIQHPILVILRMVQHGAHLAPPVGLAFMLGAGVPVTVGIAYVFYWLVERNCVTHRA